MFRNSVSDYRTVKGISDKDKAAIEGLIGKGVPPIDYDVLMKQKREAAIVKREGDLKVFLEGCLEYYDENYPESEEAEDWIGAKLDFTLEGTHINNIIGNLANVEREGLQKVLDYCHMVNREGKRHINDNDAHDRMNVVSAKIRDGVPGFNAAIELERLEYRKTEIEKQKNFLNEQIKKDKLKEVTPAPKKEVEVRAEILKYKPSIEDMTVRDIKELLDAKKIKYNKKARKMDLIRLIPFVKPKEKKIPNILKRKPGLSHWSIENLKEILDVQGTEYKKDATKLELIELLQLGGKKNE